MLPAAFVDVVDGPKSGGIGEPSVAPGVEVSPAGGAGGEIAGGVNEFEGDEDDGRGTAIAVAVQPATTRGDGSAPVNDAGASGGAVGEDCPPEPRPFAPTGAIGLPLSGRPRGVDDLAFDALPFSVPNGCSESMLFRDSDTYTPYPTAANTPIIIRFFNEFMFVLPDESSEVEAGGSYEKSQNNAMAEISLFLTPQSPLTCRRPAATLGDPNRVVGRGQSRFR